MRRSAAVVLVLALAGLVAGGPAAAEEGTPLAGGGTPTAGVATEELFRVDFPAAALPAGEVFVDHYRTTLAPGVAWSVPALTDVRGVAVEVVLEGAYAVRSEAGWRVQRAGPAGTSGTAEPIAPGTEAVLNPGDVLIETEIERAHAVANRGATPVVTLGAFVYAYASADLDLENAGVWVAPAGVVDERLGSLEPNVWPAATPGPVTLALRRLTLAPGASLGPYPVTDAPPELLVVEAGRLELGVLPPGAAAPTTRPLRFRAGQAVPFAVMPEGTRRVVANGGDEPLVVLALTVAAAEDGTPVAGTPAP